MCQCLQFLNDSKRVAGVLMNLISGTEVGAFAFADSRECTADTVLPPCVYVGRTQAQAMEALQVAFLLVENENQQFLIDVCAALPQPSPPPATPAKEPKRTKSHACPLQAPHHPHNPARRNLSMLTATAAAGEAGEAGADAAEAAGAEAASATTAPAAPALTAQQKKRLKQLRSVVSGSLSVNEYLSFLHSHNKTGKLDARCCNVSTPLRTKRHHVSSYRLQRCNYWMYLKMPRAKIRTLCCTTRL